MGDPHFGFIVAAYAVAAAAIALMIGSVVFDYRRLSDELERANRALATARGGRDAA